MRFYLPLLLLLFACTGVRAQTPQPTFQPRKMISVRDMQDWKRIRGTQIGADGRYVLYTLSPDVGDPVAVVYDERKGSERRIERPHDARLSYDGRHLIGLLKPAHDTVRQLQLAEKKKAKKQLAEMDSLLVWNLAEPSPVITPKVYGFKTGERWAEGYAYTTHTALPDSLAKGLDKEAKRLVVRSFSKPDSFYLEGVTGYVLARDQPVLLAHQLAKDSTWNDGVYRLDMRELRWKNLSAGVGEYAGLALNHAGTEAAFLSSEAEARDKQKPWVLHYHRAGRDSARVVSRDFPDWLPRGYRISDDYAPRFHGEGGYVFFGTTPRRLERDTTLLDNELADVEIWNTEEPRLYTQQNVRLGRDAKATFLAGYDVKKDRSFQLATPDRPYVEIPDAGDYVLVYDDRPYAKETTWEGFPGNRNSSLVNLRTGDRRDLSDDAQLFGEWTPDGSHVVWYDRTDTTWNSWNVAADRKTTLTTNAVGTFYDELNDRPMHPYSYGDFLTYPDAERLLLYDRYDIWEVDPAGRAQPRRVTRGRETGTVYRLQDLDRENDFVNPDETQLVTTFSPATKEGGFAHLNLRTGKITSLRSGPKTFGSFQKARLADRYVYTRGDFVEFPDLRYAQDLSKEAKTISNANPQQVEFNWGHSELYTWVDNQGRTLQGMLIKPDNFDPARQYPMIVNFYERSSDRLHRHPTPYPGRSSINYAHYVSQGYVIFNPDVIYRVGYPGESAYDCVMSGVTSLIGEGFVDRDRIGLQGHSWGGYQAAYLVTKTDLFAAVESGAPVVNMFSAYGGIRWGSGLSRQFQYERTQSRIGGSPWEYPLRYLENSPLFTTDKINTPLLILHNDADGAVPWYQGIEWFTALRRLGKPAWLLNYRGEPHWPVKTANRADFQTRMEQFFAHYLLDQPMPAWMEDAGGAVNRRKGAPVYRRRPATPGPAGSPPRRPANPSSAGSRGD